MPFKSFNVFKSKTFIEQINLVINKEKINLKAKVNREQLKIRLRHVFVSNLFVAISVSSEYSHMDTMILEFTHFT